MNHPCDRRTDGQTDGRNCDSICALSIYAVAHKNCDSILFIAVYSEVKTVMQQLSSAFEIKQTGSIACDQYDKRTTRVRAYY